MKINDNVILLNDIKDIYSIILKDSQGIIIAKRKYRRNGNTKILYEVKFDNDIVKNVFYNDIKMAKKERLQ